MIELVTHLLRYVHSGFDAAVEALETYLSPS